MFSKTSQFLLLYGLNILWRAAGEEKFWLLEMYIETAAYRTCTLGVLKSRVGYRHDYSSGSARTWKPQKQDWYSSGDPRDSSEESEGSPRGSPRGSQRAARKSSGFISGGNCRYTRAPPAPRRKGRVLHRGPALPNGAPPGRPLGIAREAHGSPHRAVWSSGGSQQAPPRESMGILRRVRGVSPGIS